MMSMTPQNTDYATVLKQYLKTTADGLAFAIEQIPTGRWFVTPLPMPMFGEWPAAKIVHHVTWYERNIVLPEMHRWISNIEPDYSQLSDEKQETDWQNAPKDMAVLLTDFQTVRDEQLALFDQIDAEAWATEKPTLWGVEVPLSWVVAKTYQHTLEHTDTLMKMALFWDVYLERQQAEKQKDA